MSDPIAGCTVEGAQGPCGEPVVAAHAVRTYPHGWEIDGTPTPGVVLLCRRHASEPLIPVELLDWTPPRPGAAGPQE